MVIAVMSVTRLVAIPTLSVKLEHVCHQCALLQNQEKWLKEAWEKRIECEPSSAVSLDYLTKNSERVPI